MKCVHRKTKQPDLCYELAHTQFKRAEIADEESVSGYASFTLTPTGLNFSRHDNEFR